MRTFRHAVKACMHCVLRAVSLIYVCAWPGEALAQTSGAAQHTADGSRYPSRPIRFIVPFPPSGGADALARVVGQKLTETWRQQVVIDNRAGAGGNLAAETVAKAPPDGYTLLESTVGHAISTSVYKKLGYDLRRDFVAVTELASTPFLLVTKPTLPATTVAEFLAFAKSNRELLNYASSGNGGPSHLAMELFKVTTRIGARHIPYKGAAQSVTDLVSGQIDVMFTTIAAIMPLVKNGRVRALGIASLRRTSTAPDIPTIDESGVKGFEASSWFGVHVPAGTSGSTVTALHLELVRILRQPDTGDRLASQGFDLIGSTPKEFSAFVSSEISKWANAVAKSGMQVE